MKQNLFSKVHAIAHKGPAKERTPVQSGFSLLEILLVVSLVGGLGLWASLELIPQVHQSWVEEAAASLGFRCQEARSLALSDNRPVVLTMDDTQRTLTVWKDDDLDDSRDEGEEEVVQLSSRNGVVFDSNWTSGVFTTSGQFMALPASFRLSTVQTTVSSADARRARVLQITGSGGVNLE